MASSSTRAAKCRFHYNTDDAAFIELKDEKMPGPELFDLLRAILDVESVTWHTSKHDQGNPGTRAPGEPYDGTGHVLERNIMVKSSLFPRPMEFELTRSMHVPSRRGTVSMAFKVAPKGQLLEAWRILMHAAEGKMLFPGEVRKWYLRFHHLRTPA